MQTITTKYHGPSGLRGARMSATSAAGKRIMIPYPHALKSGDDCHAYACRQFAVQMGKLWPQTEMIGGGLNNRGDMVWVFLDARSPRA